MIRTRLAHYFIEEKIGEGGMGIVYKAIDTRLRRPVAIKTLSPHLIDWDFYRFIVEARAASALNHPNICTIYDIGQTDDILFIVLEFINGETLREIMDRLGKLTEKEVIDIAFQICNALTAAHTKGIIHRDIKPDNIMISREGFIKIMDFGLAKVVSGQNSNIQKYEDDSVILNNIYTDIHSLLKTSITTLQGTISYMAPEQIEKGQIDQRTDIYSLGIVLYELLTGKKPFTGFDSISILQSILTDNPIPPSQLQPHISHPVEMAVLKALSKIPAKRQSSAFILRSELQNSNVYNAIKYTKAGINLFSDILS